MNFSRCRDTAVIIPARNEAARIAGCLNALAPQCSDRVQLVLVVNNSDDATAEIAQQIGAAQGLKIDVMTCRFAPHLGVGEARRRGAERAMSRLPHLRHLLTTDADCRVAPDWIVRSLFHLGGVDAVCGKVALLPEEAGWLDGIDPCLHLHETAYRQLVLEVFARHAPNCADLRGSHGETPGASLGFTRAAYLAAGGFAPIPCGEDRQIIRTLRGLGGHVRHADDLRVEASCRLTGRAAGGMADTLRARLAGVAAAADDCLPRADHLIAQVRQGTLGVWPPQVAAKDCVPAQALPRETAKLKRFLTNAAPAQATALPPRGPDHAAFTAATQPILAAPRRDG